MTFGAIGFEPISTGGNGYIASLNWWGTYQWVIAASKPFTSILPLPDGVRYTTFVATEFSILDTTLQLNSLALVIGDLTAFGERAGIHVMDDLLEYGYDLPSLGSTFTSDGSLFIHGLFSDSLRIADTVLFATSGEALFIARFDANDQLEWARIIAGSTDIPTPQFALAPTGAIYLAGDYSSPTTFGDSLIDPFMTNQVFLLRLDETGHQQWLYSSEEPIFCNGARICTDPSGGVYLSRTRHQGFNATDVATSHFSPEGVLDWTTPLHFGYGGNWAIRSVQLQSGGLATAIRNFTNGPGVKVVAVDENGTVEWEFSDGADGQNWATDLFASSNDALFLTGSYEQGSVWGPFELGTNGGFEPFVVKLSSEPVGVGSAVVRPEVSIAPNPAEDHIMITCTGCAGLDAQVTDALGKVVTIGHVSAEVLEMDIARLPEGLYLLKVGSASIRFIKQ